MQSGLLLYIIPLSPFGVSFCLILGKSYNSFHCRIVQALVPLQMLLEGRYNDINGRCRPFTIVVDGDKCWAIILKEGKRDGKNRGENNSWDLRHQWLVNTPSSSHHNNYHTSSPTPSSFTPGPGEYGLTSTLGRQAR